MDPQRKGFSTMPSLGPTELALILVLALILFGAGKLSDVGGALGKSIREFRHAATDDDAKAKVDPPSQPPTANESHRNGPAA
jgi:sec-independent protein translocase protein TatA